MKSRTCTVRTYVEVTLGDQTTGDQTTEGRTYEVAFDRITAYSHDPNADCNADGNRGHAVDYIDEDRAENIAAEDEETGVTVLLGALADSDQAVIQKAVDDYLEQHDPEPEEEYDPREDRDDEPIEDDDAWSGGFAENH